MRSFEHQIGSISTLNFSQNNIGLSGATYLASAVQKMRSIKSLILSDCHLGDRGVKLLLEQLEDHTALDILDLSANQIGQSSYFKDSAPVICNYIQKQT